MVMKSRRTNLRGSLAGMMLAAVLAMPSGAQELPKGVTKVTSVEGITEYNLENGLKVLMFPDPSKPTVTVNVTYWWDPVMKAMEKPAWPTFSNTLYSKGLQSIPTFRRSSPSTAHGPTEPPGTTAPTTLKLFLLRKKTSSGRSTSNLTGWSTRSLRKKTSTVSSAWSATNLNPEKMIPAGC
jgi:hypothetical protein